MSPPAQKDLPTALITSAPTSDRASTSSNVAISSSAIAGVSAFRRSGAFSVTIATAPSTSSSTSPDPATSPPSCRADQPHAGHHLLTGIRPRPRSGRLGHALLGTAADRAHRSRRRAAGELADRTGVPHPALGLVF